MVRHAGGFRPGDGDPTDGEGAGLGRGRDRDGRREVVGDHGRIVSLEHYGASADYARLYQEFGITAEAVAAAATDSIRSATD